LKKRRRRRASRASRRPLPRHHPAAPATELPLDRTPSLRGLGERRRCAVADQLLLEIRSIGNASRQSDAGPRCTGRGHRFENRFDARSKVRRRGIVNSQAMAHPRSRRRGQAFSVGDPRHRPSRGACAIRSTPPTSLPSPKPAGFSDDETA